MKLQSSKMITKTTRLTSHGPVSLQNGHLCLSISLIGARLIFPLVPVIGGPIRPIDSLSVILVTNPALRPAQRVGALLAV